MDPRVEDSIRLDGHHYGGILTSTVVPRSEPHIGLTDKLKDLGHRAEEAAGTHKEQFGQAVRKAGQAADQRTGGKYHDQITKVAEKAEAAVDKIPEQTPPANPADPSQPGRASDFSS